MTGWRKLNWRLNGLFRSFFEHDSAACWLYKPSLFWCIVFPLLGSYRALRFYDRLDSGVFEASWDGKDWFSMPLKRVMVRGQFHHDLFIRSLVNMKLWEPHEEFLGFRRDDCHCHADTKGHCLYCGMRHDWLE